MQLDLASLSSVREFAEELLRRFDRVHRLVCNAGVMVPMEEYRYAQVYSKREGKKKRKP